MGEENGRGEGDGRGEGMGGRKRKGGRGWEEDDGRGEEMGKEWEKWDEAMKGRQTAHHDGEDNTDLLNNFEDAEHS